MSYIKGIVYKVVRDKEEVYNGEWDMRESVSVVPVVRWRGA